MNLSKDYPKAKECNAGTTACVSLITEDTIYVANCGDSRCVMNKSGSAIQMSIDHKLSSANEVARIKNAGGTINSGRIDGILALPRSIGDLSFKQNKSLKLEDQKVIPIPDVKVEKLTKEVEFIIIACDGVWDCIGCQEAVSFVDDRSKKENMELSKIIEELFETIIAKEIDENCMFCIQ